MDKQLFELTVTPFIEKGKPFKAIVTFNDEVFIKVGFRAKAKTTKGVTINAAGMSLVNALTERVKSMGVEVIQHDRNGESFNMVEEYIRSSAIRFKNLYDYDLKRAHFTEILKGLKIKIFIREDGKIRGEMDILK